MESESSAIHAHRTQSTLKDFPGRMAALFFTAGCNFRCGFCHNPDLFVTAKTYSWDELDAICATFRKQWVSAATITGGEPTLHASLPDTIRFMKKRGFSIKLDTNGSNPQMLEEIIDELSYVAMDIKCGIQNYPSVTGYDKLDNIRQSISIIMTKAKDYEFRTTVIETLHNEEEIMDCGKLITGAKRYILQPFVPRDNLPSLALRTQPRTRPSFMEQAASWAEGFAQTIEIRG